jgi:SOS-response transcriptional repressor LexA
LDITSTEKIWMTFKPLTPKQRQCFDLIVQGVRDSGFSPTYQDLRISMGYSVVGPVQSLISVLLRKGYISTRTNPTTHKDSRGTSPARNLKINAYPIAPINNSFERDDWLNIPNANHALRASEDIPHKLIKAGDYVLQDADQKPLGILRIVNND